MNAKMELKIGQNQQNVQLLQGRITTAKWLSMKEPEVAKEISEVESDPLFNELMYNAEHGTPIFSRKRWPASSIHTSFYELKEELTSGSPSGDIHDLLENRETLIKKIKGIGIEAFEEYFLYGEGGKTLSEICTKLKISLDEGRSILDLVIAVGARSEFYRPGRTPETSGIRYHCIAEITRDPRADDTLYFQFFSPHWSRGKYVIQYERLEEWKKKRNLTKEQKRNLRQLLKRIELLNMRQDTLFQILSRVTTEQSAYLRSRQDARLRPLSLRELARRIGVAPSTVSRSISNRAVRAPWGEEIPMKSLLTGQRVVILAILSEWARQGQITDQVTDDELTRRLAEESAISVSRRTINDCRRLLTR